MSLLVATTKTSDSWSDQPGQEGPEQPGTDPAVGLAAGLDPGQRLLDLVDEEDRRGHRISDPERLADVRSPSGRRGEPIRAPTSMTRVGRPVSLPSALAKADFPVPGTPRSRTPRGRTPVPRRPPARAFLVNALRASRPPRSAKVSPPRCRVSRPDFLSMPVLSSQRVSGTTLPVAYQGQAEGVLGLDPGQARRRIEDHAQVVALRQFPGLGGDPPGDLPRVGPGPGGRARRRRRGAPVRPGSGPRATGRRRSSRSCLPWLMAVSRAWTISAEPRKRWKFGAPGSSYRRDCPGRSGP